METLTDILQLSPPLALALLLNLVGFGLKKSKLPDWTIPLILIGIGAGTFPFIAETAKVSYQCHNPSILMAIYGGCIGGLSVGLNQALRQFMGRNGNGNGSTPPTPGT